MLDHHLYHHIQNEIIDGLAWMADPSNDLRQGGVKDKSRQTINVLLDLRVAGSKELPLFFEHMDAGRIITSILWIQYLLSLDTEI